MQIKFNLFTYSKLAVSFSHREVPSKREDKKALTEWTTASAWAAEQQNGLSAMLVLVLIQRGIKEISHVHFWNFCPQNNPQKTAEGLRKALKGCQNSTVCELIHRTLSTQGLIIFKEKAYIFYFFFSTHWHSIVFYMWSNSVFNSPGQLASICCLGDECLPKLMGVLDCFNGKVLQK